MPIIGFFGAIGATGSVGSTVRIAGDEDTAPDVSSVAGATVPTLVELGPATDALFVVGFAAGVGITGAVVTCAPTGRIGRQKNAEARTKRVTPPFFARSVPKIIQPYKCM